MKTYNDLEVWKLSIDFVNKIYDITDNFPKWERYDLGSQMRRAAVSIPSNISEGAARHYNKEFIQFLYQSLGSTSEIETQLIIASNRLYIQDNTVILNDLYHIQKLIHGLIRYLKNK